MIMLNCTLKPAPVHARSSSLAHTKKKRPRRAFGKRPPAPRKPKGKTWAVPFVGAHGGGSSPFTLACARTTACVGTRGLERLKARALKGLRCRARERARPS